ncbi:DUF1996 domain-containing protein [Streptomyces sp. DSM 41972]|uniref:DUF1996 domain-containing protein n=1 Tax=Streptomyces althioticus subsp. attaecolombicae TaxID=3075534 RepID=A0ABU3HRQ8_9ACTN|nr:DUF1996 domain-containing protein [Streptomyces sp. DSM 41972]SCE11701.1 protein of unknown function [Streptomyces sp. di50b]SCE51895.1 protein of unknown function [Streptomyces sp. di188]
MGRNTRKRRTPLATKVIAGAAALAIGGGGLVWANFYASAHEKNGGQNVTRSGQVRVATINCPDVGQELTDVPREARRGVARELARLDRQITEAYSRLAETRQAQAGDASFVDNAILGPLKDKRRATLDRIDIDIKRAGGQGRDLGRFARCQGVPAEQPGGGDGGGQNDGGQNGGQDDGVGQDNGGQAGNGPVADDFIRIEDVQPGTRNLPNGLPANGDTGSTGSFTTECGTNENALRNSDNVIAAPGVSNGAQHQHDYVGNQANTAFASDEDLANGETTCQNQGDRSTYFWPVLRIQDGTQDIDQDQPGGGQDGNVGKIVAPTAAELTFVGNRTTDVVAMPRALRIITGDAKSFTNGLNNANTAWSCTGFEDRQVTDKYPICPEGSGVVRTTNFQSCWDGQNTDSANHRTHTAFVQQDGTCPNGFQAIPQLQVRLVYDNIPAPRIENGQVVNPFALDSFPEQLHKPITDHNDFINFFDENLMNEMVRCINNGQDCQ